MVIESDNYFASFKPERTVIALLTLAGMRTLEARRNMDRVELTDELLLLDTNLNIVVSLKIIAVSADFAENGDRHNGLLL